MTHVLLISNDKNLEAEVAQLPLQNARITRVSTLAEALSSLKLETFPLCFADQRCEGLGDPKSTAQLKEASPETNVIVLLFDKASAPGAVVWDGKAASGAAFDLFVQEIVEQSKEARDSEFLRAMETQQQKRSADILGVSEASRGLRVRIRKVAGNSVSVLIEAEEGSDAELVAQALHGESGLAGHFVKVSCLGVSRQAMLDLLLGTQAGHQPGAIEMANEGTLLLDQVQALAPEMQELLVKIFEEGEIRRQGSPRTVSVNVRWIARSVDSLKDKVKAGRFREDLYWKLCGVALPLVPLRERIADIDELFRSTIRQAAARRGRPEPKIQDAVLAALKAYDFPGNEEELRQLAEVALVQSHDEIGLAALPVKVLLEKRLPGSASSEAVPIKQAVHEFERQVILETLRQVRHNQSKASRRLGIHRNTLILKMQELGIPNKRQSRRKR